MTQARPFRASILALALFCALAPAKADDIGVTTQRIVVDPLSGLALYGYDPVAYFIDKTAAAGRPSFEWRWAGATWRFASEANRAEFMRNPEAFAPAYGGYDGEGVLRRTPIAADPTIFVLRDDRVFLFRSPEAKQLFFSSGGIEAADKLWPGMLKELIP